MGQDINQWLAGDGTYNQQLANYQKQKQDYENQYNQQVQNTNRDYATSNRALTQQGVVDRQTQLNDYAGRGILNSGLFGTALADYNTNFNTKVHNLLQGQNDTLNNYGNARTNYLRQLQFDEDNAKQDAIQRRATSLGLQ